MFDRLIATIWHLRDAEADDLIVRWVIDHLPDLASVVFGLSLVFALGNQSVLTKGLETVDLFGPAMFTTFWISLIGRIAFVLMSWLMFYRTIAIVRRASSAFLIVMMVALGLNLLAEVCFFSTPVLAFFDQGAGSPYIREYTCLFLFGYFFLLVVGCALQTKNVQSYAFGHGLFLFGLALFFLCLAMAYKTGALIWSYLGAALCLCAFAAGRAHNSVYRLVQGTEIRALMQR